MAVLQGKSREIVTRELQRTVGARLGNVTNKYWTSLFSSFSSSFPPPSLFLLLQSLDVNQAVNNLLSRDDDGGEGGHEEGVVGFFPSGGEYSKLRESVLNIDSSLFSLQKSC